MKQFLVKTILISTILLIIMISTNYHGDAARIFDEKFEQKVAEIIISGQNVTNISNYDERILQKKIIQNFTEAPNTMVLGSSRTMLIDKEYFEDSFFFNNSVSGATIEDIIGIYQLYKNQELIPKKILIGIDPWFFNEYNGFERWKSLSNEYSQFINLEVEGEHKLFKYRQLISPSYFQASIKSLILNNMDPIATGNINNLGKTKLSDGSLVYGDSYRLATAEAINIKVKNYLSNSIYGLKDFRNISVKTIAKMDLLIDDMLANNIEIVFIMMPYHPKVYRTIKTNHEVITKTEEEIRRIAKNKKIKIVGSYNPETIEFDETYFYDAMHIKEKGVDQIINSISN